MSPFEVKSAPGEVIGRTARARENRLRRSRAGSFLKLEICKAMEILADIEASASLAEDKLEELSRPRWMETPNRRLEKGL